MANGPFCFAVILAVPAFFADSDFLKTILKRFPIAILGIG